MIKRVAGRSMVRRSAQLGTAMASPVSSPRQHDASPRQLPAPTSNTTSPAGTSSATASTSLRASGPRPHAMRRPFFSGSRRSQAEGLAPAWASPRGAGGTTTGTGGHRRLWPGSEYMCGYSFFASVGDSATAAGVGAQSSRSTAPQPQSNLEPERESEDMSCAQGGLQVQGFDSGQN